MRLIGLPVAMVVVLAGAGMAAEQPRMTVENLPPSVVKTFLQMVDDRKYLQSWDDAAAFAKDAVSKTTWALGIQTARRPLGKLISRKVISKTTHTSLPGCPDGTGRTWWFCSGRRSRTRSRPSRR